MKTYTLSPDRLAEYRHRQLLRSGGVVGMVLVAVVGMGMLGLGGGWVVLVPLALVTLGGVALSTRVALRQQQRTWESLRIELGEDEVAFRQEGAPEMRLRREEVTALHETGGGVLVRTEIKFRALIIPNDLDPADYEEIKATLSTWAPLQGETPAARVRSSGVSLALLVGLGIIVLSGSLGLVVVASLAMCGYYVHEEGVPSIVGS
jgi:hypothetical protein